MKETFIIYAENEENVNDLTDEQAGKLFKALFRANAGDETEPDDVAVRMVYRTIRNQIRRTNDKYEETRKTRSDAGKKGAESRWGDGKNGKNGKAIFANGKNGLPVPVPVPVVKETTPKGVVKKSRFAPPTPEQVSEYCKEKGYTNVDAERFVAFYESKGWMVGKNKMTDWKAAVRNWNRSERPEKSTKPTGQEQAALKNRFNNFQQREYDYAALERQLLGR